MDELIKKSIIEEVQAEMTNIDVKKAVDILDMLMAVDCPDKTLMGIQERYPIALSKIFDKKATYTDIVSGVSDILKIEPIFKMILFFINPEEYNNVTNEKKGFSHVIRLLGLNPENLNLDVIDVAKYHGKCGYIEHISQAYKIRNSEAHTCERWGKKTLYYNINCVLIAILYCVNKHNKILINILEKTRIESAINVTPYMNELIGYFKDRMKKYISLNGEENLTIANRYVYEYIEDDRQADKEVRYGTIDNLRRKSVPENRMILWGEAGTGKSTTLEYLAYVDAIERQKTDSSNIPVLIPLGLITDMRVSLRNYISKKLSISDELLEDFLHHGKLNLFFDGLNEIPGDARNNLKTMRIREIQVMINNYKKTFIIMSNRPGDLVEFKGVPIFNLIKLSDEQQLLFLNKNTHNKQTIKVISEVISNDERLKSIVRTPLMLSRLIDIVNVTGKIPKSEGEIIGAFLNNLLTREREEKEDINFDVKKTNYLLRTIAYEGLNNSSTNSGMKEDIVISYMTKCMKIYSFSVDTFYILEILLQLGILMKRDNLYLFTHQAYQDYYCAQEELAILGVD